MLALRILSEFSAVWLAHVLWEHGVAGSNPAIPMPERLQKSLQLRLNNLNKVVESSPCFSESLSQ